MEETEFDFNSMIHHNRKLTGNYRHYCPDAMSKPIDDSCEEFAQCKCGKASLVDPDAPATLVFA